MSCIVNLRWKKGFTLTAKSLLEPPVCESLKLYEFSKDRDGNGGIFNNESVIVSAGSAGGNGLSAEIPFTTFFLPSFPSTTLSTLGKK